MIPTPYMISYRNPQSSKINSRTLPSYYLPSNGGRYAKISWIIFFFGTFCSWSGHVFDSSSFLLQVGILFQVGKVRFFSFLLGGC
jgi:hypothetical protein